MLRLGLGEIESTIARVRDRERKLVHDWLSGLDLSGMSWYGRLF
jgi:hypothetical protein